jgi:hypothetical protein
MSIGAVPNSEPLTDNGIGFEEVESGEAGDSEGTIFKLRDRILVAP